MNQSGEEQFKVRCYEVDSMQKATLFSIVNYFQEAASNNAIDLGVSVYDLRAKGVSWVLNRMQVHIDRLPKQGELVTVKTWPSGFDRVYFYRDFLLMDNEGKVIASATSLWLVFNIESRKLEAIPDFLKSIPVNSVEKKILLEKQKIPKLQSAHEPCNLIVTANDIDVNGHVNNAHFTHWLQASMPSHFLTDFSLIYFDVSFKREVMVREKLYSISESIDSMTYIHVLKNEQGQEVATGKSKYSKV